MSRFEMRHVADQVDLPDRLSARYEADDSEKIETAREV